MTYYKIKPNNKNYTLNKGMAIIFTKNNVKWHLEHIDIFYRPDGTTDKKSEKEIQAYLYSQMFNCPIRGKIIGYGSIPKIYHIEFSVKGFGTFKSYFEYKKDFKLNELLETMVG